MAIKCILKVYSIEHMLSAQREIEDMGGNPQAIYIDNFGFQITNLIWIYDEAHGGPMKLYLCDLGKTKNSPDVNQNIISKLISRHGWTEVDDD